MLGVQGLFQENTAVFGKCRVPPAMYKGPGHVQEVMWAPGQLCLGPHHGPAHNHSPRERSCWDNAQSLSQSDLRRRGQMWGSSHLLGHLEEVLYHQTGPERAGTPLGGGGRQVVSWHCSPRLSLGNRRHGTGWTPDRGSWTEGSRGRSRPARPSKPACVCMCVCANGPHHTQDSHESCSPSQLRGQVEGGGPGSLIPKFHSRKAGSPAAPGKTMTLDTWGQEVSPGRHRAAESGANPAPGRCLRGKPQTPLDSLHRHKDNHSGKTHSALPFRGDELQQGCQLAGDLCLHCADTSHLSTDSRGGGRGGSVAWVGLPV